MHLYVDKGKTKIRSDVHALISLDLDDRLLGSKRCFSDLGLTTLNPQSFILIVPCV